jgi:hypothetical protein
MSDQKPTMTIRPLFNLAMAGGLFVLMMVVPLFTDLPFLPDVNLVVYFAVVMMLTLVFLLYLVSLSYQWIELDDNGMIRGRKLISRRLDEWSIDQVVDVYVPTAATGDSASKSQNYKISFEDGTSIILVAGEMTGMTEFMSALERIRPVSVA